MKDYNIFSPSELSINLGDTVFFENLINHNAVEVSEGYISNIPMVVLNFIQWLCCIKEVGTYYYNYPHAISRAK